MIIIISSLIVILSVFITYKYYIKPKREIKKYLDIFRTLGYSFYEIPFTFMGLGLVKEFQRGLKSHKDALWTERTVYTQVDLSIGNIFDKIIIEFVNPDLIKGFLNGNVPFKYPKYQLMVRGQKSILGNGIIFSEGEVWKSKRRLLSQAFNFQLIKANIPKIAQICGDAVDMFEETHKIGENKYQYNLIKLAGRIFNGVIMKCFFGTDHVKETIKGLKFEEFVNNTNIIASELTFDPLIALLGKFAWNSGLTKKIRQTKQAIDLIEQKSTEIVRDITEKVHKQPIKKKEEATFLIEALIYAKMENKEEVTFSDKQLVEEFQTFLVAGTDTASRFFTMMIYYLARNPEKLKKMQEQVDQIIKSDADITYQNLKKLTYIDWCQLETTRLFGPGNGIFPRIAQEDNKINDIPITKGTIVTFMSRGNHYSPKYFKNPEEFRPERWESECDGIHPFALVGFSAGMRNCIGKQLSYIETKIMLIKLFKRYQTVEAPEQVTLRVTFTYEPEPFDVVFTKATAQK